MSRTMIAAPNTLEGQLVPGRSGLTPGEPLRACGDEDPTRAASGYLEQFHSTAGDPSRRVTQNRVVTPTEPTCLDITSRWLDGVAFGLVGFLGQVFVADNLP